jgi:beta-mannosidase
MIRQWLHDGWQAWATDAPKTQWPVNVPGTLMADLAGQGVVPDWFYADREAEALPWLERDYVYSCEFRSPADAPAGLHWFLECDGLDTLATIRLDGREIGRAANQHRRHRFALPTLDPDEPHRLEIEFASAMKWITEQHRQNPLPGVGTTYLGYQHLRKAHCHFGWDWGIKLPDLGIWRNLALTAHRDGRIDDLIVVQHHRDGRVDISATAVVERFTDARMGVSLTLRGPDGRVFRADAAVSADGRAEATLTVPDPALWWPNGYGAQPLYSLHCELRNEKDEADDVRDLRLGLRSLDLVRDADAHGESFYFRVNGVPVFAKGGNWIPADALHGRRFARLEALIRSAVDVHSTIIRVWGGASFEDDRFYDLCDELGLLVWQDLPYACSQYPYADPGFRAEAAVEAHDAAKRLRHRACLALWCGNNEIEEGIIYWGSQHRPYAEAYQEFFESFLPDALAKATPVAAYWPSSPSSGGKGRDPHDPTVGDCHYWSVWHGGLPFTAYAQQFYRFQSEFGFQSFPCLKTLKTYCPEDQYDLESPAFLAHQRCGEGNRKIQQMVDAHFGPARNFPASLYLSLAYQALAVTYGIDHWRRLAHERRCMGTIYWQLNDNWPVASWSSIDYFGRWKPLHYAVRRSFAPATLTLVRDGDDAVAWLANDAPKAIRGSLRGEFRTLAGNSMHPVAVAAAEMNATDSGAVARFPLPKAVIDTPTDAVLWIEFTGDDGQGSGATLLFAPPKDLALRDPAVKATVSVRKGTATLRLNVANFAPFTVLDLAEDDVVFSDNFLDLVPGRETVVTCPWTKTAAALRNQLEIHTAFAARKE